MTPYRSFVGMLMLSGLAGAGAASARTSVSPYLEIGQVVSDDFSSHNDVLTYSMAAAGVEARTTGRRASLQASYRYERRFTWGHRGQDDARSSGILRGQWVAVPELLSIEAGALASRARINPRGVADLSPFGQAQNTSQIYSVYAGPSLARTIGSLDVKAAYRLGLTKIDSSGDPLGLASFDRSIDQEASASLGMRPGVLPFGWMVSGQYSRSDQNLLDLQYDQGSLRGDLTVPLNAELALTGGAGVQRLRTSSRPLLFDGSGNPLRAANGHLLVDRSQPRQLSYDLDDLMWDVGLTWQPSPRVRIEVRTGQAYASQTYQAALHWQAGASSSVQAELYDAVETFGQELGRGLAQVPTQFSANRSAFSGPGQGCAFAFGAKSQCLNQILGSLSGSLYRSRGASLLWTRQAGAVTTGLAIGYRDRHYLSTLARLFQPDDRSGFVQARLGYQLSPRTDLSSDLTVSVFDVDGQGPNRNSAASFNTALTHRFTRALTSYFGVGLDAIDNSGNTRMFGNAAASLRYSF